MIAPILDGDDLAFRKRWLERGRRRLRWIRNAAGNFPHNIVVDTRWRLGDEIMAIPVYQAIKERWRNCRITVYCNYAELLEENPYVDAINENPGLIDRYVSLRGAPRGVRRIVHCAKQAGLPAPSHAPRLYYSDWDTHLLAGIDTARLVGLARGASWTTKQWPLDRWRALSQRLEQIGYAVVDLGHATEQIGTKHSLAGLTTVKQAAQVLRHSRLLICSDSGLMHLALACGTPALALFGPTAPEMLVHDNPLFHTLTNGRPCQGCWNISRHMQKEGVCPLSIPDCLGSIGVEDVLGAAIPLLESR